MSALRGFGDDNGWFQLLAIVVAAAFISFTF